ncbi:MAG: FecR domain-containing protein [Dysgonamonadaceae bacterium]|jgi:ferric-dicitrate binding protein FerR (iron transport regulator)|nr:FecR domain-containing protein [Dysgonamonadaceae bacterium]
MNKYIHKVIELYTQQPVGEPAKSKFHLWLADRESSQEKDEALFQVWENTENVATEDTLASLASLKTKHKCRKERRKIHIHVFRYAVAIAILIAIPFMFFLSGKFMTEPAMTEYYSMSEQIEELTLPDGSKVFVNTGSWLLYSETYGKKTRTVYLAGEANFKVRQDKSAPFIVKSKNFSITALGTEFDVSAYPNDAYFKTTLISGSAEVRQNGNPDSYILKPAEQFTYHGFTKQCTIESVNLYDATAWQRDEYVFNSLTLPDVLDALEQKYNVSFRYAPCIFNEDKYNFRFKKHSNISSILKVIMEVNGDLEYEKTGDLYRIAKKKKKIKK